MTVSYFFHKPVKEASVPIFLVISAGAVCGKRELYLYFLHSFALHFRYHGKKLLPVAPAIFRITKCSGKILC